MVVPFTGVVSESLLAPAGEGGPKGLMKAPAAPKIARDPFHAALAGERQPTPPIWLMRQAGRYLPEYRDIRAKAASFLDFCYTPALAVEATLQPIRRFGLDAAILFSDILVLPDALGQSVSFESGDGPRLDPIDDAAALSRLSEEPDWSRLAPVFEALDRLKVALPDDVALIGFCGAPWTVASYMIAGRGTPDQAPARLFAYRHPDLFQEVIDRLVDASAEYLSRQFAAGAEALQIFNSWAGVLPPAEFERWCVAPIAALAAKVRAKSPYARIIAFPRGAGTQLRKFARIAEIDAIGLDTSVEPRVRRRGAARAVRLARQSRSVGASRRRTATRRGNRAGPQGIRDPRAYLQSRPRRPA